MAVLACWAGEEAGHCGQVHPSAGGAVGVVVPKYFLCMSLLSFSSDSFSLSVKIFTLCSRSRIVLS